ncbi:MAG: biofilm PGA synthesis N-glycosyltransferase PgaC [Limisphaerales bacterium]|jgi:biofilm PGA synthesis N-glycosyltransferase PgaC
MNFVTILFWSCLAIVLYTYVGYGIVLFCLVQLKRLFKGKPEPPEVENWPEVSLVVAAYNEEDWIADKIKNHLEIDYPKDKIHHVVITDGSDDETANIASTYKEVTVFHQTERKGKIAAVHRCMPLLKTELVVFTDANTLLNKESVKLIIRHFEDEKVGAVAGEKRIIVADKDAANAAGEGMYWKYESTLKRWDSELYSVVGAAGELFSIRRSLYRKVPPDTVIEDFYLTLSIAKDGYRVIYEPGAYAAEGPSASVGEELKRKVRIAAGGIQAIIRLAPLLNIFKYGMLSFQYISHRVLRWTITPIALLLLFISNAVLASSTGSIYTLIFAAQIVFYLLALGGYILEKRKLKVKAFFIPYYFFIMNYAVFAGFWRNIRGSQSVLWEKAKRSDERAEQNKGSKKTA